MQVTRNRDVRALLDRLVAQSLPSESGLEAWSSFLQAHASLMRRLASDLAEKTGLSLGDFDVLAQLANAGGELRMNHDLAGPVVARVADAGVVRLLLDVDEIMSSAP